jgi:hypothetical protein
VVGRAAPGATIELFRSPDADPSGAGEGRKPLGTILADANGDFAIVGAGIAGADWLTATATVGADTSEFSVGVRVVP